MKNTNLFLIKCHVQTCGKCEFCAHEYMHQTILIPTYYQKILIGVIRIWLDLNYQYFNEDLTLLEEISGGLASIYGRLKTDKLLSENEEKYRNLVETLNEGMRNKIGLLRPDLFVACSRIGECYIYTQYRMCI